MARTVQHRTDLPVINVDLTVFGDSVVIETRLPRAVYGRLQVGDEVAVVDDSVESRVFEVAALTNDGRDARLVAH